MKNNRKKGTKPPKRKRRKSYWSWLLLYIMICSLPCVFYLLLYSQNMNLSEQDKELSQKVSQQEKKVDRLSSEVNSLQEKSRVLGILDDDVAENRKNVYIID